MSLSVDKSYKEENLVVSLTGELDASCAEELKQDVSKELDKNLTDVVFDMSNLAYIDSTGIGIIVFLMKKLSESGKELSIINAKANVLKIFNITGIDQLIKVEG